MPKVSICIPTYNYGSFISDAIRSVLDQTFDDFELIVVDNCSTDDTRKIVEEYAASDVRIKYYFNETNIGMVGNWNQCLKYATGDYVKLLCADDLLEPTCIEKSVVTLDRYPQVAIVACSRLLVTEDKHPINTLSYSGDYEVVESYEVIKKCLFSRNIIGEPSAVLFRRNLSGRGFDARYKQLVDLEMWLYLLRKGDFAFIPEVLCHFRQHNNQTTKMNVTSLVYIEDEFSIYNEYINNKELNLCFIQRHEIKYLIALRTWHLQYSGYDPIVIRKLISRHYGLYLFCMELFINKLIQFINRVIPLRKINQVLK